MTLPAISRRLRHTAALLAATTLLAACSANADSGGGGGEPASITVAAASDLRLAFTDLGKRYEKDTGGKVIFTFGSSGQLSQQITKGAPFDVFASASTNYVDDVVKAGKGIESTRADYAYGRLAIWTNKAGDKTTSIKDLTDAKYGKIAIANPEHAPYGVAAVEALKDAGIYDQVKDRLVYGENISDTLRLATSGNAQSALVSLSLVINRTDGAYTLVPEKAHKPLRQVLVVTAPKDKQDAAKKFADLVNSAEGRKVMDKYGFVLPGERTSTG
ncbi:molybdate ABC transporter substrate-binding protein [Streptomyces jeddahensis]|uniref:Molybdate-binding periplasmic protein n=1 Tax=Streptomyces jeddahensis TaxID=1716141 RepID=A0A177HHB5_9ACTN|nr:molybdate ABC transporter substrate-binding protein [Streptomyces jeddahensis]OAH10305.1 molybdate-binding periplasmic protein precursor [Streptomyces jeddahensis]